VFLNKPEAVQDIQNIEQFLVSMIAAARVYITRTVLLLSGWNKDLQDVSGGYTEESLMPCVTVFMAMYNEKFSSNATLFIEGS
jgi:Cyclin, C-terminal domain